MATANNKTNETEVSVDDFLNSMENNQSVPIVFRSRLGWKRYLGNLQKCGGLRLSVLEHTIINMIVVEKGILQKLVSHQGHKT